MNPEGPDNKASESDKTSSSAMPKRSGGTLSQEELEAHIKKETPLAYDPLQAGWILETSHNDLIGFRECLPKKSNSSSSLEHRPHDLLASHIAEINEAWAPELKRLKKLLRTRGATIEELLRDATQTFDRLTNKEFESVEIELEDGLRTQLLCSLFTSHDSPIEKVENTISFRDWQPDDLEKYHSFLAQEEMWEWIPDAMPSPFTLETARQFLDLAMRSGRHRVKAIESNGQLVGQIRLLYDPPMKVQKFIDQDPYRVAEISFWIGKPFWGRGIMKSALASFLGDIRKEKELDAVYAWIHPGNVASAKAVEYAGFVRDPWGLESRVASFMRLNDYHRYFNFIPRS